MELKTRYQYTYFIYPYVIEEKNYSKYLLKLLKDKKCTMKKFDIAKDLSIYQNFLPNIRKFMFWSFNYTKQQMRELESLDNELKANILSKYPCTMFDYNIKQNVQGKVQNEDGIYFDITKVELICFNTGICFLLFKTIIDGENNKFSDVVNFNYKFRDITSKADELKEFENIKIQTSIFKDSKDIIKFIKDITGNTSLAEDLNIDQERFITYSYACISQEDWNDNVEIKTIEKLFFKFFKVLPAHKELNDIITEDYFNKPPNSKYIKYGFSNVGTALLTSDIAVDNYTKLPFRFENEQLYLYILCLYKKFYLAKVNYELDRKDCQQEFFSFTKNFLIEEVSNDETESCLEKNWSEKLDIDRIFNKIKNKYDMLYKSTNVEKTKIKQNIIILILIVIMLTILYALF
ncbi:unknown [Clostridium sp. CAG:273]|nr:unknown [Clostridium sp. CAG:273]